MASSRIREVFEEGARAFNAHDFDAFARTLSDDVSVRAPGGVELRGKQAVVAFYKGWVDGFPDARIDTAAAAVADDVVVEEGVFHGTHRGTLRTAAGDLPATGREVRVSYLEVIRYRGDQRVSFHLEYDRAEMMEQLGLAPAVGAEAVAGRGGAAPEATLPH